MGDSMDISYRKAKISDAYGIQYVASKSWFETYCGLLPYEYLNNRLKTIDKRVDKTKEFIKNNPDYIVAIDNNKVIGICHYTKCDMDNYKDYGRIGALYLLKEYHNLGIGKNLLTIAIKGLMDMGYKKIELECMCGNKSIDFYKKYGGVIADIIDYPINNVGNVKADIVVFEDIDKIYNILTNNNKKSR